MSVKPPFGTQVKVGHALARRLVGAWLFNEARGAFVLGGAPSWRTGVLTQMEPSSDWVSGPEGPALDFDGGNDRILIEPEAGIDLATANACVIRYKHRTIGTDVLVGHKSQADGGYFFAFGSGNVYYAAANSYVGVAHGITGGQEVWLGVSRQGTSVRFYKNGHLLGTPQTLSANNALAISTIGGYWAGVSNYTTDMRCDYVYIWSRALSGEEVAWLYREPYCFVGGGWGVELLSGVPTVRSLQGTAGASSSASGSLSVLRACDRPTGKPWPAVTLDCDRAYLREALFGGMTDAGYRLGTAMTQGWFWMRRAGASAVYRGQRADASTAAFGSPVAMTAVDARQATLPAYLSHEPDSVCCYVVRRFNGSGDQERTIGAAVVVRMGTQGPLAQPAPNPVVGLRAVCTAGDCVRLAWFYCPVGQEAAPRAFHVYWDAGTGELDLVHPLAQVPYEGRKYYSWQSGPLEAPRYRFAVRAETAGHAQSTLPPAIRCDAGDDTPDAPNVIAVETV